MDYQKFFIVFFACYITSNIGCSYEEDCGDPVIGEMFIVDFDVEIYSRSTASELLGSEIFGSSDYLQQRDSDKEYQFVILFIKGESGGCDYYHETTMTTPSDYLHTIPIWNNTKTIEIKVTEYKYPSDCTCPDGIFRHEEVLFLGLFPRGKYTINVNHIEKEIIVK